MSTNTHAESQTPKSPIIRCSHGRETSFEGKHDKSGFGDFGDWQHVMRRVGFYYILMITKDSSTGDAMSWFCCDATIFCNNFARLPLPNEDFGRLNNRWHPDFEGSTFQGREYSIWATNHWKINRKSGCHLLFRLPKSSFGEHKDDTKDSRNMWCERYGEQKIAQFRTHYLTKGLAYVSTQPSGYFSIDTKMI